MFDIASKIKYDPTKDLRPEDKFGPLSVGKYLLLPEEVKVHFICKEDQCEDLELLLGKRYIGVDAEWRAAIGFGSDASSKGGPAIIQISSEKDAFIVDLIALANSQVLDTILCKVFNHPNTVIVGFSFHNDLKMLARFLKNLKFYKKIGQLLDI